MKMVGMHMAEYVRSYRLRRLLDPCQTPSETNGGQAVGGHEAELCTVVRAECDGQELGVVKDFYGNTNTKY